MGLMCIFVVDNGERVRIQGLSAALSNSFQPRPSDLAYHVNGVMSAALKSHKKRVAVLISGSGKLHQLSCQYCHSSCLLLHLASYTIYIFFCHFALV